MKTMILGVVEDLRARRLLPVAVLLILALVAAPILLLEPAKEAPAAPAAAAPERSSLAAVELENDGAGSGESALAEFDARDPFASRRPGRSRDAEPAPAPPPADDGEPDASASPPPPSADAAAESKVPLRPLSPALPSGRRAADPPAPDPRPAPRPTPPPREEAKRADETAETTETVDVKVGRRGDERLRRDVKRLDLLPSERSPLLVFLGTSLSGRSAVFLVDADLTVSGDGSCDPSPRNCSFLTLRPDRRHDQAYFEDSKGRKWTLKLLEIGEMPVDRALEQQAERAKRARATAAARTASFAFPALSSSR